MSNIHSNQSSNCLSMEEKKQELKIPKPFIEYSQTIDYAYEKLEDYNPTKKIRVLLVFDYMLADMEPTQN